MTVVSKNLDSIIDDYNNTYHRPIKIKLVNVKDNIYTDFGKEVNDKEIRILNSKLVIM